MKTYFRLLSFAKPIEKYAIPYVIATILATFFNTFNFTLLSPLLNTIFLQKDQPVKEPSPANESAASWDLMAIYDKYVHDTIAKYGDWYTLQVICGIILCSVLLSNLFKYIAQRYMEDLR